ncbi:MAG: chemotaxis protein CheD [Candidatus Omnitrophica bacterium]|nr:chemotaxis protein CheD [Candidatus Omnitrophota bacterium]
MSLLIPIKSPRRVFVGIAELAVLNDPDTVLTTFALGSCLGVAIYDPEAKVGGMVHVMLPDSRIAPAKAASRPGMFIDTGIPALFRAAYRLRADKRRLLIYAAGGAQIMDGNQYFNIGRRNCQALTELLDSHCLRIASQQVGGWVNRILHLSIRTGEVRVKVSGETAEVCL